MYIIFNFCSFPQSLNFVLLHFFFLLKKLFVSPVLKYNIVTVCLIWFFASQSTIFQFSCWVFLGWTSTKQVSMCQDCSRTQLSDASTIVFNCYISTNVAVLIGNIIIMDSNALQEGRSRWGGSSYEASHLIYIVILYFRLFTSAANQGLHWLEKRFIWASTRENLSAPLLFAHREELYQNLQQVKFHYSS